MRRYFHKFLDYTSEVKTLNIRREINLKCDAKYFGRFGRTMVFKERRNIIFWYWTSRETYLNYTHCFLTLERLGYRIKSVTSDKHGSCISVVKSMYPGIPHQHCLVHIQKRCQTLLTQKPETEAGVKLLELVKFLNRIKTHSERKAFFNWFERYSEEYKEIINQRTYNKDQIVIPGVKKKRWWYTHKNLRLAFNTVKSSLDNIFFYLDDSDIPKDTNGLEAEFTHLKQRVNDHRGLSRKRRENFVAWYWSFKSKNI